MASVTLATPLAYLLVRPALVDRISSSQYLKQRAHFNAASFINSSGEEKSAAKSSFYIFDGGFDWQAATCGNE